MVLTKHNESKPSASCSQKHGMQNFPNIQQLIGSQKAIFYKKIFRKRDLAFSRKGEGEIKEIYLINIFFATP